jgi:glucose-1-phosphate thymidylyltransferase
LIPKSIVNTNSKVIEPCFIGNNVQLLNSTVGPHVSIGDGTIIENSIVKNSIIQTNSKIKNADLSNSMIGNFVEYTGKSNDASIGDYSTIV